MVKLSIIIPYYKTYELTNELLKVLVPQLTNEVEVILIDDGCNEKRLDKYSMHIKLIHSKKNNGGATTCNMGIDMTTGKYIGFIDSDDMIATDYIKTLLDAIDNHNEDVIFMDWKDMGTNEIVHHPDNYAGWKAIYSKDIIPRFDESYYYSFDVPFYDKLNSKPYSKYYIDKVLYYYNSSRENNLTHLKEKERRKDMIKVEAIVDFTLEKFDELVDVVRKNPSNNQKGKLYDGDTFYCKKDMAEYLTGNNDKKVTVVKVLEVILEEVKEKTKEVKKSSKKKGKK